MKRKNWAIVDEDGLVYTGDVGDGETGWSSMTDDACLFATEDRATYHIESNTGFGGCKVKEVR